MPGKVKFLVLTLMFLCVSAFCNMGFRVDQAEAYVGATGKKIIYSYDSLDGVSSSEKAYPYGKMIEASRYSYIQPVFSDYASTDWTDAKYLLFYADNRNNTAATLGFCITSAKQSFTPKASVENVVYLDDMTSCVTAPVKFYNNGIRNGIELPARFKGYVKVKVDDGLKQFDCNIKNGVFNYTAVSMVEFKGSNVYVAALALSYDDDITSVLDESGALFGRSIPVEEPFYSGKIVVDEFLYEQIKSTESEYSNYMLPLSAEKYSGKNFSLSSFKDWKNVEYTMFYVHNQGKADAALAVKLNTNGKTIAIDTGSKVYIDDLAKIKDATVDENGYFQVAAGFQGYVKIPFNTRTFVTDKSELIDSLNVYADRENDVFIDNVAIVYDDDINSLFEGLFDNRPFTDFENEGIDNDVYVMPNFYEIHKGNGYFDGVYGINENHATKGNIGKVEYSKRLDSMTVTHNSKATGVTMWGQTNPYLDTDWRDAKYVLIKIKNKLDTPDKFCVVMARTNTYVNNGAIYYLKDGKTGKTDFDLAATGGSITVPANFDGYVLIPCASFGADFNWSNMPRISFMFSSTAGKLTFGIIGKALSDKALSPDYAFHITDESIYFEVPEQIPYPTYPERVPTEPADMPEKNGCGGVLAFQNAGLAIILLSVIICAVKIKKEI